jgi:hypothetical protein
MSAPRDLDRLLRSFLKEGPLELPDPSYDEVRDRMEHTRQRAFIGPWRTPVMNRYLQIGVAAAAVVLIAVIAFNLLPGSPPPGGAPSASPSTEPSTAEPSGAGGLPLGPFALSDGSVGGAPPITVTIPAPGWSGAPNGGILIKNDNPDPPDGSALIVFGGPLYVYGDPCQWSTTKPDAPATTVDELVAALASQASRDASAPVDVTLGGFPDLGYHGKSITLHVPDDAVFSQCDRGYFGSWALEADPTPSRYHQGPGQIDELWVLDVNGLLTVIDGAHYGQTPLTDVEELHAIIESTTFGQ